MQLQHCKGASGTWEVAFVGTAGQMDFSARRHGRRQLEQRTYTFGAFYFVSMTFSLTRAGCAEKKKKKETEKKYAAADFFFFFFCNDIVQCIVYRLLWSDEVTGVTQPVTSVACLSLSSRRRALRTKEEQLSSCRHNTGCRG